MTLLRERSQEVAAAVAAAGRRFPWYAHCVAESDYPKSGDPDQLPLVTAELLLAHYYGSSAPLAADERAYFTSGTETGRGKRIVWSSRDHAEYVNHRTAALEGFVAGCRSACSDLGTGHAAASALEVFERLGLQAVSIDFTQPLIQHVETLNRTEPDVLFTMPMILDRILASGRLRARLRKIIVLGDIASPAWCLSVAHQLAIAPTDILDLYGSIEVGSIAVHDHSRGTQRLQPHIIAEVMRSGNDSVLVLTSLARTTFPAIRFVTGDVVEGFYQEAGGGGFQAITGRLSDDLKHGEKISRLSILEAVHAVLKSPQVAIHREDRRIVLEIASPQMSADCARRIVGLIRQANPEVDQMIRSGLIGDIEVRTVGAECGAVSVKGRILAPAG